MYDTAFKLMCFICGFTKQITLISWFHQQFALHEYLSENVKLLYR